jgi:hypothetical protein
MSDEKKPVAGEEDEVEFTAGPYPVVPAKKGPKPK